MTLLQVILPVTSSVPATILPTPDGPDPPSDLASSVPALSLPTLDGPALSDPTPDGSPPSPAQLQCDVDPDPAPTLDATASPAPQESVVAETVERLSAVVQQKGLAFNVSILPQFVQDASVSIQLTFFFLFFFFKLALFRATTLQKVSPGYTHKHGAELGKYK